jgi:hypothetical protein
MRTMRRHLTYANVVSTLCLFILLGGVSYAAIRLPRNSVGPKQIKANAVTTEKVKDQSLQKDDFGDGQLPAGPKGDAGAQGPRGEQGEPGPKGDQGERGLKGDKGDPGEDGADGQNGADGQDGADGQSFHWKGEWSALTAYTERDAVSHQGSSYIANTPPQLGEEPGTATSWELMAEKGDQGAPGEQGIQGEQGPPGTAGQNATTVYGTGGISSPNFGTAMPGLSQTVTVPAGGKLYVSTDGAGQVASGAPNAWSTYDVAVHVNGGVTTDGLFRRFTCFNPPVSAAGPTICPWSMSGVIPLPPGDYTVDVRAMQGAGSTSSATVSGNSASALQGQLTTLVVKE